MVAAYPLQWPEQFGRRPRREPSRFRTSLEKALSNVETALARFATDSTRKITRLVISSNVSLGDRRPADPGVAVWFEWDGLSVCIPVDRYDTAADNLQAIFHVIEARRTELRHGTLELVRATLTGFRALPAPARVREPFWWVSVLGLEAGMVGRAEIEAQFRKLAFEHHPDRGGDAQMMAELNEARAAALRGVDLHSEGHDADSPAS